MRKRECRTCGKDYPTIVEDDCSAECAKCEENWEMKPHES